MHDIDSTKKEVTTFISFEEMENTQFEWIASAEAAPTISLETAKSEWANRKKHLQSFVK
jgi:hypothetical protein